MTRPTTTHETLLSLHSFALGYYAAQPPAGWVKVPEVPTDDMAAAAVREALKHPPHQRPLNGTDVWQAMLAAAPALNHSPEAGNMVSLPAPPPPPFLWVNPEQADALACREGGFGKYLPVRQTSEGKFTLPLYEAPPDAGHTPPDEWHQAVLAACMSTEACYVSADPHKSVSNLIAWHVQNEQQRPSVLYRPALSLDGSQWCALYGVDLQSGTAGFGDTPEAAMRDFDAQWVQGTDRKDQS